MARPSTPPPRRQKPPFWRDPAKRALFFQAIMLLAVFGSIGVIVSNTLNNMQAMGISTGFGFLDDRAGFGIIQSLIDYSPASSYGRTFVVGLLNTLLVSALGVVAATILGFLIGIARLSPNWLLARLASAYIETFRNIPLLLQIFFWYFAVLRALPSPRDSISLGEAIFLNVRGLVMPEPMTQPGLIWTQIAVVIAIVASIVLIR